MIFEKGYLYHVYNQGNNREKIFFNEDNYIFFLKKINNHILPYADILAWCLMPNHFHLMLLVNEIELAKNSNITIKNTEIHKKNRDKPELMRSFNNSIAILLRSYTRAINKQEKRSGSLFRESTKALCVNCFDKSSGSYLNLNTSSHINEILSESQYPQICFNYIHQNPVKAKLVTKETDWKFSSARAYAGLRKVVLIDKKIAKDYVAYSPGDSKSSGE